MTDDQTKKHDIAALNALYLDGESADQSIFAEQRSNLLLVAGEHYNRRQSMFFRRIRDTRELNQEQKLRLTKNHIQKICKLYANNIISAAPGVGFEPKDEQSIQDQKAAELHHAVWQDAVEKYCLNVDLIDQWCDDFIQVGEVFVKIFWDPHGGKVKAFEQKVDDAGLPIYLDQDGEETDEGVNELGQENEMVGDQGLPVFDGQFVFEEVYGFNILRSPQARRMDDSPWLCVRKMVDRSEMIARYRDQEDKHKLFVESGEDTFVVFDNANAGYKKVEGQCMIREYYFRASPEYPNGHFYFTTKEGIFEEGDLPGGIFPIVGQGFEKVQTTPRGRSPIKHMRPYQVEINRAASKIAEHQVTLGDDKLLIQNGTKVSAGVALPGVRAINYTGAEPEILPGRAGDQYLAYMNSQIEEMYRVMSVAEDSMEKQLALEPFSLLFRSASQKKQFQRYIKRFENFLLNVCKTYLSLAKIHLPEDQIIYAIGKNERVNIAEYKNSTDICYQIKVEAQADDIETKLGKQLSLNHVLQYVGPQMKPEDIGKLMRQMPYANFDGSFDDMTMDFDSAENTILALDRGESPQPNQYDDHIYMIKKLVLRSRQADFKFLDPMIQQNYGRLVAQHQAFEAQRQVQLQRAQQGYIPTGGYLLGCDFFVTDPTDPSRTRRARLPSESVQWLFTQLEAQGQGIQELEGMNGGAQAQIATQMSQQQGGNPVQAKPGVSHSAVRVPPMSRPPMPAAQQAPGPQGQQGQSPYNSQQAPQQPGNPNGMGMFGH